MYVFILGKVKFWYTTLFRKKPRPTLAYQHARYAWETCGSITQARVVRELGLEPSFQYKQNGGRGWFSSCEETKGLQEQILSG